MPEAIALETTAVDEPARRDFDSTILEEIVGRIGVCLQ